MVYPAGGERETLRRGASPSLQQEQEDSAQRCLSFSPEEREDSAQRCLSSSQQEQEKTLRRGVSPILKKVTKSSKSD